MNPHINYPTVLIALYFFTSFLCCSCTRTDGSFRLEGHFKNLNQGEFYLYSLEQGTKDTIAVNDGRFVYERNNPDTATLVLLFPNYSELPIFVRPNAQVKMEGDATHLRETEVTGTEENEAMTAFRQQNNEKTPAEVQKAAEKFIAEHPASPISTYLLRRYVLQAPEPDYPKALRLCATLHQAQPQNLHLARLHKLLEGLELATADGQLPHFAAIDANGDSVTNRQLRSDANVILLWTTWNYDSQNALRQTHSLLKSHPKRISVVSITFDAAPNEARKFLERDSITWPNVCDSLLWQSPLLEQLGIATFPANIVTDKQGNIVGRNLNNNDLKKKIESLLGD